MMDFGPSGVPSPRGADVYQQGSIRHSQIQKLKISALDSVTEWSKLAFCLADPASCCPAVGSTW